MRTRLPAALICGILALGALPGSVRAQGKLGLDLRSAAAIPGDGIDPTYETGFGFGAGVDYRIWKHLALYGGWDWYRFPPAEESTKSHAYSSGPSAGIQLQASLSNVLGGWMRAGGAYKELRNLTRTTVRHLGLEGGAGFDIAVRKPLHLRPALRYRTFKHTYETTVIVTGALDNSAQGETETRWINYTTLELGLAFRR